MGTETVGGEAHGIVLDSRFFPILIATWYGDATEEDVDGFFDWQTRLADRARAVGTQYVMVTDASAAARPKPSVRRRVAQRTNEMPDVKAINAAAYVVLDNPLIRGALTAMQWISRDNWGDQTTVVATCQEALERSLADLDRVGAVRPEGLDPTAYQRPEQATA